MNPANLEHSNLQNLKPSELDLFRKGEIYARKFMKGYITASLLYFSWDLMTSYNVFSFALQALLFVTYCYRTSLDRNGSILILVFLLIPIFTIFHMRHSFITALLMALMSAVLSIFIKPLYAFQRQFLYKFIVDLAVAFGMRPYVPTYSVRSTVTDKLFVLSTVGCEIWYSVFSSRHNSIDDVLCVIAYVIHIWAFYLELFTVDYFYLLLSLTVSWIVLKSMTFPRRHNLLSMDVDITYV